MAEEMEMVLTLKKWRCGTCCQSDPVLRLKSGKMKCLNLIYSPGLAKMDELPRAGAQITLLLSQMSTAHISMEEHQIKGENVVH